MQEQLIMVAEGCRGCAERISGYLGSTEEATNHPTQKTTQVSKKVQELMDAAAKIWRQKLAK